jgi:hypothetical protein
VKSCGPSMADHWARLKLATKGDWHPNNHGIKEDGTPERKSQSKGRWGEWFHALKNVGVEALRTLGVYNRGGKSDCEAEYRFPVRIEKERGGWWLKQRNKGVVAGPFESKALAREVKRALGDIR